MKNTTATDSSRYLPVAKAAEYLGMTPKALRCRVDRGTIPYRKIGGRLAFDRRELDRFIAESPGLSAAEVLGELRKAG